MTPIDLPKEKRVTVQQDAPRRCFVPADGPKRQSERESENQSRDGKPAQTADAQVRDRQLPSEEVSVDLRCEGANMLELQARQSVWVTPLGISSKAAQVVLRQF
jgi:hypothetical protein